MPKSFFEHEENRTHGENMSWINGLNEEVKKSIDKFVKLPENGSIDVILRIDNEPVRENKQWAATEPAKTSYVWQTADGRTLRTSEKLTLEITTALLKHAQTITAKNLTEVAVEIANKGSKTKPIWFVSVKGGY